MSDVARDELFSAYLDGELTAAEQTRVEQLLATDPAARQLVDDLRALGATLQSLPQHKLDESLSQRVLEAAEQRKRAKECDVSRVASDAANTPADFRPWWREVHWRHMLSRRALFWSALAVAIAVIIRVTDQPQPAKQPAQQVAAAHEEAKQERQAEKQADKEHAREFFADHKPADAPARGLTTPSIQAPGSKPAESAKLDALAKKDADGGQLAAQAGKENAAPAPTAAPAPPPAAKPQAEAIAARGAESPADEGRAGYKFDASAEKPKALGDRPDDSSLALRSPNKPSSMSAGALAAEMPAPKATVPMEVKPGKSGGVPAAGPAPAPEPIAANEPALPSVAMKAEGEEKSEHFSQPVGGSGRRSGLKSQAGGLEQSADAVMVVCADITAEAARNHLFEHLLAHNGLAGKNQERAKAANAKDLKMKLAEAENGDGSGGGAAAPMRQRPKASMARRNDQRQSADSPVILRFEVDATPAQVRILLAQLAEKPDTYSAVAIEPSSAGATLSPLDDKLGMQRKQANDINPQPNTSGYGGAKFEAKPPSGENRSGESDVANRTRSKALKSAGPLVPSKPSALKKKSQHGQHDESQESPRHVVFELRVVGQTTPAAAAPAEPAKQ